MILFPLEDGSHKTNHLTKPKVIIRNSKTTSNNVGLNQAINSSSILKVKPSKINKSKLFVIAILIFIAVISIVLFNPKKDRKDHKSIIENNLVKFNNYRVVTKSASLNVRQEPNKNSLVVHKLPKNSIVFGRDCNQHDWIEIIDEEGKTIGFAFKKYLTNY